MYKGRCWPLCTDSWAHDDLGVLGPPPAPLCRWGNGIAQQVRHFSQVTETDVFLTYSFQLTLWSIKKRFCWGRGPPKVSDSSWCSISGNFSSQSPGWKWCLLPLHLPWHLSQWLVPSECPGHSWPWLAGHAVNNARCVTLQALSGPKCSRGAWEGDPIQLDSEWFSCCRLHIVFATICYDFKVKIGPSHSV